MKKWILISTLFFSVISSATPCDPNSILEKVFLPRGDEVNLETISTDIRTMDDLLISETQKGKSFNYWVDDRNQIQFTEAKHLPKKDAAFVILQDHASKESYIIKEWGDFTYDPKEKAFVFKAKNSWDLRPGEVDDAIRGHSKINYIREADPSLQKSQVVKCTELLASQERGDAFIKDGLMISGFVTTAGFVTANPEVLDVDIHDKKWKKKALLLSSDLAANITSSYISGKVVKPLLTNNANIYKDFIQRNATDFATNALIKRPLFNAVNSDVDANGEKSKIGNKLLPYDTGFGVVRFFPKRAVQKWTLGSLPKILVSSCLKNSKLNIIVGPRMVRLADQYVSGYIYMLGRKAWLNENTEEKK